MSGGTNTQTQTLPDWLQPYLTQELGAAQGFQQQATSDPQSMVAGMTPAQQQGISSIENTANSNINPSASAAAANQFETSGALLNPSMNPYLQGTFNQAAQAVQNNLDTQFAGSGSNVQNSLPVQADQMNNLATQLYGGAYNTGLQQMTQASALAPSIQQGTYLPGQELYQAGGLQQQQQQSVINAPYNALSWYSGLLGLNGSNMGGQSSSNVNGTSQDVGMGLAAAGTAAEIAAAY